jgi:hypothetical protein
MTRTSTTPRFLSAHSGSAFRAATRPLGRAALSCGLAGALSLGAAGAALANGHDGAAPGGGAQGRATGQKSSAQKSSAQKSSAQKSSAQKSAATKKAGTGQSATPAKGSASQPSAGTPSKTSGAHTSAPRRGHDPRGNNGTIKVDGPAWDARVDNEPHTSCAFRVTFFGFDEGQTADITVTGVAPTGGGVLLHETAVPTSDDRAGGAAHDFDGATRVYTADDLGLDAVAPHPQQGYHLKVAVDSLEAPGGAKQKVLWLEPCGTQAPVTPTEGGAPEQGGQVPSGTVPGGQPETPAGPQGPEVPAAPELPRHSPQTAPPALRAEEAAYREEAATALAARAGSAAEAPARASARTVEQASALPNRLAFTGAAGLELLALTGAAAAAAGAGLLVARRSASAGAR